MKASQAQQHTAKALKDYASHARAWESSGIKQKAYCQGHGLSYAKFVASRSSLLAKRGDSRQGQSKFIPVRTADIGSSRIGSKLATETSAIIVRLPKGSVIEIPPTLPPAQLSRLLKSLGGVLC